MPVMPHMMLPLREYALEFLDHSDLLGIGHLYKQGERQGETIGQVCTGELLRTKSVFVDIVPLNHRSVGALTRRDADGFEFHHDRITLLVQTFHILYRRVLRSEETDIPLVSMHGAFGSSGSTQPFKFLEQCII